MLALKTAGGHEPRDVGSQRSWKSGGKQIYPLEMPEKNSALQILNLSVVRFISDFRSAEMQDETFVLF